MGSGFRGEYQTQVDEELPIVNARAPYTLLISDQSIHYLVARLGYDKLITWSNDRLAAFNNDLLTTCRNSQAEAPHLIWPVRVASDSIYGEVPDPPSEVSGVRENASEIEDFYQRIGWRSGPFASREAQKSVRDFWVSQGDAGAKWLVERLARETHVDVLDGAANLLADIGPKSVEPIVNSLEHERTRDHAEVLLKALGWIEAPQDVSPIHLDHLVRALATYLAHPDADIRAAASAATRILPYDRAIDLLTRRRESESDPEVLEAIDDACKPETASESGCLLWRKGNRNRWVGRSAESAADVDEAAKDFALRETGETYLSFFLVRDRDEGRQVAAVFMMVGGRPDRVDFLLLPRTLLTEVGISVVHIPDPNQHVFLSSRHFGTVGPKHLPDRAFIEKLLSLLTGNSVEMIRMSKGDVIETAKSLFAGHPDLDSYLGEHWRKELLGE